MTFGQKLKQCRKSCGMTQAELAQKTRLSVNTIINYERGNTYPQNREIYHRLAQILGEDADYLHNENDNFIASAAEKYGYRGKQEATRLVRQLGGLFAGGELSEEDMDGVMRTMQDFYWRAKDENRKYASKKKDNSRA